MCLCGCSKGQTLFERINSQRRHTHMVTGMAGGHNHSQAVIDPQESLRILCEEIEDESKLVREELLKMKGHITQLTNYLLDQDGLVGKKANLKELINDEAKNLLIEARDEIRKLRAESGFLSEDDMELK